MHKMDATNLLSTLPNAFDSNDECLICEKLVEKQSLTNHLWRLGDVHDVLGVILSFLAAERPITIFYVQCIISARYETDNDGWQAAYENFRSAFGRLEVRDRAMLFDVVDHTACEKNPFSGRERIWYQRSLRWGKHGRSYWQGVYCRGNTSVRKRLKIPRRASWMHPFLTKTLRTVLMKWLMRINKGR